MLLLRLHNFEEAASTGTTKLVYVCHTCGMLIENVGCSSKEQLDKYIAKHFEPCTGELTEVKND